MNDISVLHLAMLRIMFLFFGLMFVIGGLIPFDLTAGRVPGPNLLFCVTFVLVIRRPEVVPVWSIFAVYFLQELFSSSAFGLWTLLVVLATELVRTNLQAFREYNFMLQCLWFGSVLLGMLAVQKAVLTLSVVTGPTVNDQMIIFALTLLCYPVTALIMEFIFGIDTPAPGELDARGQRL